VPKMKTITGAKRRFSVTGTGKVMRAKLAKRHNKAGKSARVRRMDEHKFPVAKTYKRKLQKLLPYGA
jgi:large subunit ribosomal protein L35